MQEAYIVAGYRTAVTKSKKGGLRFMRSDELAIEVIKGLMQSMPQIDPKTIDDVIVGTFIGGFVVSTAFWLNRIIKKRNKGKDYLPFQSTIIILISFVSTFVSFIFITKYISLNLNA